MLDSAENRERKGAVVQVPAIEVQREVSWVELRDVRGDVEPRRKQRAIEVHKGRCARGTGCFAEDASLQPPGQFVIERVNLVTLTRRYWIDDCDVSALDHVIRNDWWVPCSWEGSLAHLACPYLGS